MARPHIAEGDEDWYDEQNALFDYLENQTIAEEARAIARENQLAASIVEGPAGPEGPEGPAGAQGPPGADGVDGVDGVDGAQGPPGADGVDGAPGAAGASITWQGAWITAHAYALNDAVANDDVSYVCVLAHTSSAAGAGGNEPGVGATWSTNWAVMTTSIPGATGATGATGAAGADGKTLRSGTGVPSSGLGVNGDFYIDPTAQLLYGPKASGAWPAGVNFKGTTGATGAAGADGKTILNGTGVPSSGLGVNGDFYYDTAGVVFYGPKAAGAWPAGVPLVATSDLSPWVVSGNLPTTVTVTGDAVTGVWTVLGALGATETLEG